MSTLTGRRKAATQLDIAKTAVAMFAERGTSGVTAQEIALASGVSLRTFYRYFRTKEDSVAPMLSAGASQWQHEFASAANITVDHVSDVIRHVLTPSDETSAEDLLTVARLLQMAQDDQLLQDVWLRVNQQSEVTLAGLLEGAFGGDVLTRRLVAAAATTAIKVSLETWAFSGASNDTSVPATWACDAFIRLSTGLR